MITLKVKILRTWIEKSVGLIGVHQLYPIFFTTRWGIHTFGMKSPIDVLILDNNNRVVKSIKRLPPNYLFFWNPKYDGVIELPPGAILKKKIFIGNQVSFRYN